MNSLISYQFLFIYLLYTLSWLRSYELSLPATTDVGCLWYQIDALDRQILNET